MPRELTRLTIEATPGTFNASPATGDQIHLSLPGSNSNTVQARPLTSTARSAGHSNRRVAMFSSTGEVSGDISTLVRPSQAAFLFKVAGNLTSGGCPELPSFTVDRAIFLDDGSCTARYRRYLGCRANLSFSVGATGDGVWMSAKLSVMGTNVATITSTDYPTPADTLIPDNERPFAFQDVGGHLTIGGARTHFSSLSFDFGNKIAQYRGESKYPMLTSFRGRDPKLTLRNLYRSQQDRQDFEAVATKEVSFSFEEAGWAAAFELNAQNYITAVDDDLKQDEFYEQSITIDNCYDTSAGGDLTVTVTAPEESP